MLRTLREKEPGAAVAELLASPTAQNLFQKMNEQTEQDENTVFVKCPHCGQLSEIELRASNPNPEGDTP